ncbi:MAG: OmpA family protein [Proteobacteria bacterium]|nr:OmpA family protein [Pseudomonadota bacterium]MBU4129339.1 OmpA family protein [Pseudomonadota bacterium]
MEYFLPLVRRLSGAAFFIVSAVFLVFPAYAGPSLGKELVLAGEYRENISSKTQEIFDLNENLTWLEHKIERLKSLEQPVPSSLYRSVAYKIVKLNSLEKERQAYQAALEEIEGRTTDQPIKTQTMKADMIRQDQARLMDQIKKSEISDWFELIPDQEWVKIRTTLPILFPSGSAVIAGEYDDFLKKISAFVKNYKVWIVVDGFADVDPIRTPQFPSNFELGAIRAANIVHALVNHGVNPSVFKIASTGKYRFPDARQMSGKKALERYINITILFEAV